MEPSDFNISGGSNQILPNATQSIQVFISKDAIESPASHVSEVEAKIMDMCYFSDTLPDIPPHEIIRRSDIALCEKRLESDNVLCLTGESGVGLTTLLAQFARVHHNNCVSYFYNGLDRIRLSSDIIERSIAEQLYCYVYGQSRNFDKNKGREASIEVLYTLVLRQIKQTGSPLYFVFDGFNQVPTEVFDSLHHLFVNLQWEKVRFIFSGSSKNIQRLFRRNDSWHFSENELICFGEADVKEYFHSCNPNINESSYAHLYSITRGNAHRMDIVRTNYINRNRLDELLRSDISGESDLYKDDFKRLFTDNDILPKYLFALLAYTEFPLRLELLMKILEIDLNEVNELLARYKEHISVGGSDQIVSLSSEGFHKYLRKVMQGYKQQVELKMIKVLETEEDPLAYSSVMPAIYKSLNQTDKLLDYLSTSNVQRILVKKGSQASLNEQCDFGYMACKDQMDKYMANIFRFALNKSTSRQIERNELWDNEIEALISVGNVEQALALAQNVYLSEERLKSYILIARKKKYLDSTVYDLLKDNIDQLVKSIDFENIPSKAVELAKLLLPLDYEVAIGIIDRVAKKHKQINADRLYTLFSLAYKKDPEEGVNNSDLASSKIQDDNLRQFAHAAKSLFADVCVDDFLAEIDHLPSNSQKLHFLQFWLPEHKDKENIGKAVLEAIKLIVADSDTEMPKAKVLDSICQTMSRMTKEEATKAMVYIQSLGDTIKYPTFDYVDAELTIIEAIKDKLPEQSQELLENLYLYVTELKDDSVRLTCLSKLLGRFDKLGKRAEVEKTIGSTFELHREIVEGVKKLFSTTAFHLKIVEPPISALVCGYPSMIDELIADVNTETRRSKAYSYAACQYLIQMDESKLNLKYFFELVSKTSCRYADRMQPLTLLSEELAYADHLDHQALLPAVKQHFHFIEEIENAAAKCTITMQIFLWVKKNFPEDKFADYVKNTLLQSWESIDMDWAKIEMGFYMAKIFGKISKEGANEMIGKCQELKRQTMLSSSSCVSSYLESIDLYTRSLCNLIKLGLCTDEQLHLFAEDIENVQPRNELIKTWGYISLSYYLANNTQMFRRIGDKYFPTDYSKFSAFEQKNIIYHLAPALFIRSQEKFFTLLEKYDECFRNDCIMAVCQFIYCKHIFLEDINFNRKGKELSYTDFSNLLVLLEHSSDDEMFFNFIEIICKSIKVTYKDDPLSTEQKNTIITEARRITNLKLPTHGGIQHDGYKIACLAALDYVGKPFATRDKAKWRKQVDGISNKADEAFLYFMIAPYFSKREDKQDLLQKGIDKAESITSNYDKVCRLDMSISECIDNKLGDLVPKVANSAMKSLAVNGTLEDHKRLIDMVYQHKPELAEQLIEKLDNDPARIQYKRKLLNHIDSVKKLSKANKEMDSIDALNKREQMKFFDEQLSNLMDGTGQLQDVNKAFSLTINHIYNYNIADTKNAVVYLMSTVAMKHDQSKNQQDLLMSIHNSIRYNLKLVLSLAAGSKERLLRIEGMIRDYQKTDDGYIAAGERDKAIAYLLGWYQTRKLDNLVIIDPYFSPSDLHVIKQLTDVNNELSIKILTHRNKFDSDDYTNAWDNVSAGIKTPVRIDIVYYADKPEDGPLHDRYWICTDEDEEERMGIKLNSVSGLGKKESSITAIEDSLTTEALLSYSKYALANKRKNNGRELKYDHVILE